MEYEACSGERNPSDYRITANANEIVYVSTNNMMSQHYIWSNEVYSSGHFVVPWFVAAWANMRLIVRTITFPTFVEHNRICIFGLIHFRLWRPIRFVCFPPAIRARRRCNPHFSLASCFICDFGHRIAHSFDYYWLVRTLCVCVTIVNTDTEPRKQIVCQKQHRVWAIIIIMMGTRIVACRIRRKRRPANQRRVFNLIVWVLFIVCSFNVLGTRTRVCCSVDRTISNQQRLGSKSSVVLLWIANKINK